jgi:hypothetical protein
MHPPHGNCNAKYDKDFARCGEALEREISSGFDGKNDLALTPETKR